MLNQLNLLCQRFAAKSDTRPGLSGIYVTKDKTVATNAVILVEIDKPEQPDDGYPEFPNFNIADSDPHILPLEAAKQIESNLKKIKATLPIFQNALPIKSGDNVGYLTTDMATINPVIYKPIDEQFPEYQSIIPKDEDAIGEVNLSPEYLEIIAKTFKDAKAQSLTIRLYKQNLPVKFNAEVNGQNITAVLMPRSN